MIHPDTTVLATQLADVAARNAASTVANRLRAFQTRKTDQGVVNDLVELVNDLVNDKNELIGIAQAFEQELVAQRISEKDITYITTKLLPVVKQLRDLSGNTDSKADQALEAIKSVINVEMLTIMQLVGFNFRQAIGEPLTILIERLILSRVPAPDQSAELQLLNIRRETALFEMLTDPDARRLFERMNGGMGDASASATT